MGEVVAAVGIGVLMGATLGHPRGRGVVVFAFGVPAVIFAGLALIGKADVNPLWTQVVNQVGRFLATDTWLPAAIGLVTGLVLFGEANESFVSKLWRNTQQPFKGVVQHLRRAP